MSGRWVTVSAGDEGPVSIFLRNTPPRPGSVLDERRPLPPAVLVSAIQTPTHPTSGRLLGATPVRLPRWTPPDGTLPDRWRRERDAVRETVASQELAGVTVWRDGPMGGETPPDTTVTW